MRADLVQVVALGCFGNLQFVSHGQNSPELVASNPAFQGVADLSFYRGGPGLMKGVLAEKASPWFNRLEKEGVSQLKLHIPELSRDESKKSTDWGLLSDGDHGLELWTPYWSPKVMRLGQPRACRVQFQSERLTRFGLKPDPPVAVSLQKIEEGLVSIASGLKNALPDHSRRILRVYDNYMSLDSESSEFWNVFPVSMSEESRALGSAGFSVLSMITSDTWDTPINRRAAGEDFDYYLDLGWSIGLLALIETVRSTYEPSSMMRSA